MRVRRFLRVPADSHVTFFIWCAMALPFLLALGGLVLVVGMLGEPGSSALVTETATLVLMFFVGVVCALLATLFHGR